MNQGKKRERRFWDRWFLSGAVDLSLRAKRMGKSIFHQPIIGCPFDDSDMTMVNAEGGISLGQCVSFLGPNKLGTMIFPRIRGKVIAIGKNAKYLNGDPFTALIIHAGRKVFFKTAREVSFGSSGPSEGGRA